MVNMNNIFAIATKDRYRSNRYPERWWGV